MITMLAARGMQGELREGEGEMGWVGRGSCELRVYREQATDTKVSSMVASTGSLATSLAKLDYQTASQPAAVHRKFSQLSHGQPTS